jgi:hypothetical protein
MSREAADWLEDAYLQAGQIVAKTRAAAEATDRATMLLALADIRTSAAQIREAIMCAKHNERRESCLTPR